MDVVNEIWDTFLGDFAYAYLLPAPQTSYGFPDPTNSTEQVFSSWQYQPSTKYLYIEPSKAAYMSSWNRDNIYRQSINLFLITWYDSLLIR